VHFLTGGGAGQPVNSVGTHRFVIEDPSRYFDEGRLPFEARHGYSVNPRPGLSVFFPSHIPHNKHPMRRARRMCRWSQTSASTCLLRLKKGFLTDVV